MYLISLSYERMARLNLVLRTGPRESTLAGVISSVNLVIPGVIVQETISFLLYS